MKLETRMIPLYILIIISVASFAFGVYLGLQGDYQESVLLYGIGFVVLSQVMFAYRILRYPDSWKKTSVREGEPAQEAK
jgi:hypothetical protein